MTRDHRSELSIAEWLNTVRRDGGIEKFHDLHVDDISPMFKERSAWVQGGLECLVIAEDILSAAEEQTEVVALAMSLESTASPQGVNFYNQIELATMLDWSPPSLYLFKRGREPWLVNYGDRSVIVSHADINNLWKQVDGRKHCGALIEFRPEIGEGFYRTLYVSACGS